MLDRRHFLKLAASVAATAAAPAASAAEPGSTLPPWQPGFLEIHHIDTGRGNATLILGPDGTSLLVDAGESHSPLKTLSPARPDGSRRAGEWIARYVARQLARVGTKALDRMLLTHLHGDHVGEVAASSPPSAHGAYRLTGAADVAESVSIGEMLDRGWPDYLYPAPPKDPSARNYIELARALAARGTRVASAQPGSSAQLALRHQPGRYPGFTTRILSANGDVWSGSGKTATSLFPPINGLDPAQLPTENMCCISLVLQHGSFRYFTGGDLTADTAYGLYPWRDIESPVARLAGPVSVAVVDHHGYFDAGGPAAVRALRPRAWVLPCWHLSHPGMNVMANLFSTDLYPGERSVFAVGMAPETILTEDRFARDLASTDGHVVVRVPPGGANFTVHVLDARSEAGTITATFGTFPSQSTRDTIK